MPAAWWRSDPPASFAVELSPGVDLLVLNDARWNSPARVAVDGRLHYDDDAAERVGWTATTRKTYFDQRPGLTAPTGNSSRVAAVVDELRVQRLLRAITDDLAVLRAKTDADPARRGDRMWLRGVKYTVFSAVSGYLA